MQNFKTSTSQDVKGDLKITFLTFFLRIHGPYRHIQRFQRLHPVLQYVIDLAAHEKSEAFLLPKTYFYENEQIQAIISCRSPCKVIKSQNEPIQKLEH